MIHYCADDRRLLISHCSSHRFYFLYTLRGCKKSPMAMWTAATTTTGCRRRCPLIPAITTTTMTSRLALRTPSRRNGVANYSRTRTQRHVHVRRGGHLAVQTNTDYRGLWDGGSAPNDILLISRRAGVLLAERPYPRSV